MYTLTAIGVTIDDLTHITANNYAVRLCFTNRFWSKFKKTYEKDENMPWIVALEKEIRDTLEHGEIKIC